MEDAIFWIFFAAILLILAIFPEICFELSKHLGFMSPSNLVFVIIIFLLVEKIFTLSLIVSQLEEKMSILSAEVALRSKAANRRLNDDEEMHPRAGRTWSSMREYRSVIHLQYVHMEKSPYLENSIRSVVQQSVKSRVIVCTSTPKRLHRSDLAEKYHLPYYVREGTSSLQDDWNYAYDQAETEYVTHYPSG